MTQVGESIAVTTITDPEKPHWVQVEYKYANGKPVKGTFLATDSSGLTWTGKLNDKGQACLSNLPSGSVDFELVSEDVEDELKHTRANIKAVLDAIVKEQKAEAAKYEKELAKQNALQQAGSHYWAYTKGFWNGAVGLVTFAKDVVVKTAEVVHYLSPLERLNNLLHATYKSYYAGDLNSAQWKQSVAKNLQDEEIKDIARILGIDVKHLSAEGLQRLKELFAEAYEITAFIADDKESLDMLLQFGKDYAGAQSSIEWAEFAGGGVFEIVLTALLAVFTGGVGNVAQATSKIRHAGKLKSLGSIFRNLGKLLKRKKLRKKLKVSVDTKKPVKTELPKSRKLDSKIDQKKPNSQTPKRQRPEPNGFDKPNGYETHGIKEEPLRSPEGRALVEQYKSQGLSEDKAVARAKNLMESGSSYPKAVSISEGEKLYKVVPEGSMPGQNSAFFGTEKEINALKGQSYDQISDKLGIPLESQQTLRFDVVEVTAQKPTTVFESVIAPTTQNGYSQSGQGIQTLITDRSVFSAPKPTGIKLP